VSNHDPIPFAVRQFRRLPGIGERTATRLVYWLLRAPPGVIRGLSDALLRLEAEVHACSRCGHLTAQDPCAICTNPDRDPTTLCVVEHPQDVLAFERSGVFKGRYHVLHGSLSPLDGVGPSDLNLRSLVQRLSDDRIEELILALDPDVEGDATALYISRLLRDVPVRMTRLAHGIAVGTEIEYADALSLGRALAGRTVFQP